MEERGAHRKLATVMLVAAMVVSTVVAVQVLESGGYAYTQPQEVERTGIFDIYPEDAEALAARARVVAMLEGEEADRLRANLLREYHLAAGIRHTAMNPRDEGLLPYEAFNLMAIKMTSSHPHFETGEFFVYINPKYFENEAARAEILENIYKFTNIPAERVILSSFAIGPEWVEAQRQWRDNSERGALDDEGDAVEATPSPGDH